MIVRPNRKSRLATIPSQARALMRRPAMTSTHKFPNGIPAEALAALTREEQNYMQRIRRDAVRHLKSRVHPDYNISPRSLRLWPGSVAATGKVDTIRDDQSGHLRHLPIDTPQPQDPPIWQLRSPPFRRSCFPPRRPDLLDPNLVIKVLFLVYLLDCIRR